MHQILLSRAARKDLKRIHRRDHERIFLAIRVLQENPTEGKYLKGQLRGFLSLRVWPYRIIYKIYKDTKAVNIIRVKHRQGVYR